jgi:16S rRNA (cytosine967-C5)-methyltransferase
MTTKFRNHHFFSIFRSYEEQSLPLDVFLKHYFRANKAIGSHDRKYLSELAYKMIRWKGLIFFLCKEESFSEKALKMAQELDPESVQEDSSIPLHHRVSFPEEYFSFLCEQLGQEEARRFCLESNFPAPTTIRVNTAKISRDLLEERLQKTHAITKGKNSPYALHFCQRVNFLILPEFKEGLFEVQDEASQLVAMQVAAKPSDHVLDYCAGSGGKALAIALSMQGKGQLYLSDIRHHALVEAKKRLKRAGVQNAQILEPNHKGHKALLGKMDWVLVDAPCSGSGTLRRNPDMKWRFSQENLQKTLLLQREIFAKALRYVKPGGHIAYATCSVFPEENEKQVEYFLQTLPVKPTSSSFQSFPTRDGMDGFYCSVLQKCKPLL